MRVSLIAKSVGIPSRYFVHVLNIVEPNKRHSASSKLPTGIDQRLFAKTVCERAISNYRRDQESKHFMDLINIIND